MDAAVTLERIRIVAGLGNPGREYVGTRHNIGFEAVEIFADAVGAVWQAKPAWKALVAQVDGGVILLKPVTFMNRSGEAVSAVAHFYKASPSSVLVVYDDVALPLGRLRIRSGGSHGGHNGMRSVLAMMGNESIPRLRIGIGDRQGGNLADHVLGRFAPDEVAAAREAVVLAARAIECACKKGIDTAMNIYNKEQIKL